MRRKKKREKEKSELLIFFLCVKCFSSIRCTCTIVDLCVRKRAVFDLSFAVFQVLLLRTISDNVFAFSLLSEWASFILSFVFSARCQMMIPFSIKVRVKRAEKRSQVHTSMFGNLENISVTINNVRNEITRNVFKIFVFSFALTQKKDQLFPVFLFPSFE